MKYKKTLFTLLLLSVFTITYAQEARVISLQECMEQAVINHPLYGQHRMQSQLQSLKTDNLKAELLPQLSINGKASLQNEVIELPISLPGISIPSVSKDQYRLSLDVNQALYRGGLNKFQNRIEKDNLAIADMLIDKELYNVKAQTKNLFFQIVLLDKQKQIVSSYQKVLESKYKEVQVLVAEGVGLASVLDVLKLELINIKQELNSLSTARNAIIQNLNELTQLQLGADFAFTLPQISDLPASDQNRFEYHILTMQQQKLENSKGMLEVKNKPMVFAFATAGVGRPGFNMLSNSFDDFYMLGLNLKWNLWDWNKIKTEKKIVDINKDLIESQKQNFELSIQLGLNQLYAEIEKQQSLVTDDPEIIKLRTNVVETAEAQFNNGSLSSSDLVAEMQKLNQAKLNQELHKIALINSKLAYIELLGKL